MAPINWDSLKDRSVLISGGASGLGEASTRKFAEHGAYITIADIADERGQALAQELGDKVCFVHYNATDWESSAAAFKHAANFGPSKTLDIVILFAGTIGERKGLLDVVLEQPEPSLDDVPARPLHQAIDVNLVGVYMSTYLALHYFRLQPKSGQQSFKKSLVLVSSLMGYIDMPYNTGYSASKYGVRGMFRSIRGFVYKVNARVNNIVPAYVLTPMTRAQHQIDSPDQPSKATGAVLPWSPMEYLVEAVGRSAVDEETDGRSFAIMPEGVVDLKEDFADGYGGPMTAKVLQDSGIKNLFPQHLFGAKRE